MSRFLKYEERLELQKFLKKSLSFKEISSRLDKNPKHMNPFHSREAVCVYQKMK